MAEKNCVMCGKAFTTDRPHKRYCSLTCREAGAKYKRMKWLEKNPGYYAEYNRHYHKNNVQKALI